MAIVRPADCRYPAAANPKNDYCCIAVPPYPWKMGTHNMERSVGTEFMLRLAECITPINGYAGYNDTGYT
ncbi:hypothetical protein COCMIDRAFT_106348 [Bipolaris oryzae ATCC 44560]|uniref:Uncharacterized protein n=1 Tax=Bipolaris oryzae ATCC 44560 TaxID=930090 RepID=W6YUZ8_COCMI|nr:uncharacterized protein COCMIDRAFT_106348 [Bipolaris oryzae ATCC 44560]EUC41375.1 hypothetical protein COCMIDRAFT_106348 [Bipolaris oryzae ATCC 44560]